MKGYTTLNNKPQGIKRYMVKSNLVQPRLNPEVEIDEGNGETTR